MGISKYGVKVQVCLGPVNNVTEIKNSVMVSFPPRLLERVEQVAKNEMRSRSSVMRSAVALLLQDYYPNVEQKEAMYPLVIAMSKTYYYNHGEFVREAVRRYVFKHELDTSRQVTICGATGAENN